MNFRDSVRLLQLMRASNIEVSSDHKWVRCSCPLAPFTHISGSDSNPSFGIIINPKGQSGYHCFTCGSGSLAGLIHRMTWTVGVHPDVHAQYLSKEIFEDHTEDEALSELSFNDPFSLEETDSKEGADPIPVPQVVLDEFPLLADATGFESTRVRSWLAGRKIDVTLAMEYGIRLNESQQSVLFPMEDMDEAGNWQIYHLHNRSRMSKAFWFLSPKNTGFPELKWGRDIFFFGLRFVDWTKPLILVESETDLLRLKTLLPKSNVLATCGPLGARKLDVLAQAPLLYLGFDSDQPGLKYLKKSIEHLHSSAALARLSWAAAGLGDAGDISKMDEWRTIWNCRKFIEFRNGQIYVIPAQDLEYCDIFAV